MTTLERAITIATDAHRGQPDKSGAPYVLHPLRVLDHVRRAGGGEDEMIAAVLHDVVEDSAWTLDHLRAEGFSDAVVAIVDALTKRRDEELGDRRWDLAPYFRFTERASRSRASRIVKRADLLDNLDTARIAKRGLKDDKRIVRYRRAKALLETIGRAEGDALTTAPVILPLRNRIDRGKVESSCPGDRPILACDFYVRGAERGTPEPGGLRLGGRVFNVDHHAPLAQFYSQRVTSTALAHEHVRHAGTAAAQGAFVVVNHLDCDSLLSSAMLLGHVPPDARFVEASISADHTGETDDIADLLQGLDDGRRGRRTEAHYLESLRNLRLLLERCALEPVARQALAVRRLRRDLARRFVAEGGFVSDGALAWGVTDQKIDSAFLPALLPDAALILLLHPREGRGNPWGAKLRLGLAAPEGLTLHDLGITSFDPVYGGRWNAGSNGRGGGTSLAPERYAELVRERLVAAGG